MDLVNLADGISNNNEHNLQLRKVMTNMLKNVAEGIYYGDLEQFYYLKGKPYQEKGFTVNGWLHCVDDIPYRIGDVARIGVIDCVYIGPAIVIRNSDFIYTHCFLGLEACWRQNCNEQLKSAFSMISENADLGDRGILRMMNLDFDGQPEVHWHVEVDSDIEHMYKSVIKDNIVLGDRAVELKNEARRRALLSGPGHEDEIVDRMVKNLGK